MRNAQASYVNFFKNCLYEKVINLYIYIYIYVYVYTYFATMISRLAFLTYSHSQISCGVSSTEAIPFAMNIFKLFILSCDVMASYARVY